MSSSPAAFGPAFAAALTGALCFACACGGGQTGDEETGDAGSVLQELLGKATRVAASGALPNSASDDGWKFGWKFYHQEAKADQNAFFSPYSISTAVAMLVAGAGSETKTEIDSALSFSNDDGPTFHEARNAVAQALDARNHAGSANQNAQALHVSNDLWLAQGFTPTQTFLDTLSAYYGAGTFLAPFESDPEAARNAINQKVAKDTEQLIEQLLPPGSITRDVEFVLTNALYFKAGWARQFNKSLTRNEPFTDSANQAHDVPMMHGTVSGGHFAGTDYETISLPYSGGELELVAIMPTAGTFSSFMTGLDADTVAAAVSGLRTTELGLTFPKLDLESTVPLTERLKALGMQQAFGDLADFGGLGTPPVKVSDAFHQATLKLDEEGTEAAAATAVVGVQNTSLPPPPIPVVFDHPFVFFIRDVQSNALLFVGHFAKP
jgi:serpin B